MTNYRRTATSVVLLLLPIDSGRELIQDFFGLTDREKLLFGFVEALIVVSAAGVCAIVCAPTVAIA